MNMVCLKIVDYLDVTFNLADSYAQKKQIMKFVKTFKNKGYLINSTLDLHKKYKSTNRNTMITYILRKTSNMIMKSGS